MMTCDVSPVAMFKNSLCHSACKVGGCVCVVPRHILLQHGLDELPPDPEDLVGRRQVEAGDEDVTEEPHEERHPNHPQPESGEGVHDIRGGRWRESRVTRRCRCHLVHVVKRCVFSERLHNAVEVSKKVIFTCRVSPKRIVKIGMKEPQPKAIVRATTMRKVSMGEANLNWKMILKRRQLLFVLPIQKDPLTVLDLTRPPFCHPLLFPP